MIKPNSTVKVTQGAMKGTTGTVTRRVGGNVFVDTYAVGFWIPVSDVIEVKASK